jgi:MFS family permease
VIIRKGKEMQRQEISVFIWALISIAGAVLGTGLGAVVGWGIAPSDGWGLGQMLGMLQGGYVGIFIGTAICQFILLSRKHQRIFGLSNTTPEPYIENVHRWLLIVLIGASLGMIPIVAMFGLAVLMGIMQWFVLRRGVRNAWLWIVVHVHIQGFFLLVLGFEFGSAEILHMFPFIYGGVTGAVLAGLLKQSEPRATTPTS